jgi:hypothetical protein
VLKSPLAIGNVRKVPGAKDALNFDYLPVGSILMSTFSCLIGEMQKEDRWFGDPLSRRYFQGY